MKNLTELPFTELIATLEFYEERIGFIPCSEFNGKKTYSEKNQKKIDLLTPFADILKLAIHKKMEGYLLCKEM